MNKSMTKEPMKKDKTGKDKLPKNLDFSKMTKVPENSEAANASLVENEAGTIELRKKHNEKKKQKPKAYKKGGKVRGSGCAKRGVRPCKMR